jgi:predicted flap endonuclease-1-like 5' DNA nuclease
MRLDYLFYLLAVVFFVFTAISLAVVMEQTEKSLWVVSTVVIGLFSAGVGYHYRPKTEAEVEVVDSHVREAHIAEPVETHVEPTVTPVSVSPVPMQETAPIPVMTLPPVEAQAPLQNELMVVKGISAKRAAELNALGIKTVDQLATASADDLAKQLALSPKITRMWIGTARKLKK